MDGEINMPTNYGTTNEKSTTIFEITPKKLDGTTETPTTATYRIDDQRTGASILTTTPLTLATPLVIIIPSTVNVMYNSDRPYEIRRVTVVMEFEDGSDRTLELEYRLNNLRYIT